MKKLFWAFTFLFLISDANARGIEPYVGADFGFSYLTGDLFDNNGMDETVLSGGLNIGVKFNENIGAELSYGKSADSNGTYAFFGDGFYSAGTIKGSYNSLGFDLFGYAPLRNQSSLLFSVGIAKYEMKLSGLRWSMEEDKTVARFGIGVESKINRNISVRAMLRYAPIDIGDIDSATELTAGIKYLF